MRLSSKVSWSTCIADGKRLISNKKKGKKGKKGKGKNNFQDGTCRKDSLEYQVLKERRKIDYLKAKIENGLL